MPSLFIALNEKNYENDNNIETKPLLEPQQSNSIARFPLGEITNISRNHNIHSRGRDTTEGFLPKSNAVSLDASPNVPCQPNILVPVVSSDVHPVEVHTVSLELHTNSDVAGHIDESIQKVKRVKRYVRDILFQNVY